AQPERLGDVLSERGARRGGVEAHRAAEEVVGVEVAESEGGVGDRRPDAAASVAGGARVRAGALRADVEQAALVHPADRAAAGADRLDVHRREPGHVPEERLAEPGLARPGDAAAADERDVVARAAG